MTTLSREKWGLTEIADRWSAGQALRQKTFGAATEMMLEIVNVQPGSRVLDVAAGTGEQTLVAARRVGPSGYVLATDISASMLDVAAEAARKEGLTILETRVMDAENLALDADSFDAVICRIALMLFLNPAKALTEMRRVVKPGGIVAVRDSDYAAMTWYPCPPGLDDWQTSWPPAPSLFPSWRSMHQSSRVAPHLRLSALALAVLAGYPGTIASLWQQAGRAGRRTEPSAAILVASSAPLDQFMMTHPDYLFGASPEHARVNPDNPFILVNHLKCAAFELPIPEDERFGEVDVRRELAALEDEGLLHRAGPRYHWAAETYPADHVSLRTVTTDNFVVIDTTFRDDRQAKKAGGGVVREGQRGVAEKAEEDPLSVVHAQSAPGQRLEGDVVGGSIAAVVR